MLCTNYTALIRNGLKRGGGGVGQPEERLLIDNGNVFWRVEYIFITHCNTPTLLRNPPKGSVTYK